MQKKRKIKEKEYDVVVIGAGNGGLIAATKCAKRGLKTLLVEQHNLPGGFATSFVRGRFEFEVALHELGNFGNNKLRGDVLELFDELGIKLNWLHIDDAFRLIVDNGKEKMDYTLPFGPKEFAKACDKYESGCYKKVMNFLEVCENCYEAVRYIRSTKGNPDSNVLKKQYPNYLTSAAYTLDEAMKEMKLPEKVKFIIASYWTYLGTKPSEISFLLFAIMFWEYIKYHAYIPQHRSHEISQAIVSRFQELGGTIWYNTRVNKIDVKNQKVVGVNTTNGYIKTNHVISNASPFIVYGELIDKKDIPEIDKKVIANRSPGSQGFCVYLGLNKSFKDLKLNDYSYFIYTNIDHEKIYENMNSIETNCDYIAVVLNVANPNCSPKGTTILSFTTLFNDAWNNVKLTDYFKTKEEFAYKLIADFEKKLNTKITPYIEEIEIATPVTFARYTGSLNGAIYGNKVNIIDSTYTRARNMDTFYTIKGLRFCGGNGVTCHGYSITYISGDIIAGKTFSDIAQERSEKQNG